MSIRLATADDLAAIMAIERASFPTDAWSETMMAAELASPHGSYVVVEEAGRIVGYGGVRAVRGAADADIQTIALETAARGTGRGRMLLAALLEHAREAGAKAMFLEVRDDNTVARNLYQREGFIETGRRRRYYQPDDVDAIIMQLDLVGWEAARREAGGDAALAAEQPSGGNRGAAQASGGACT